MKKCVKCLQEKDILEFNKNNARPDGRQLFCRNCGAEYGRSWREGRSSGVPRGRVPKVENSHSFRVDYLNAIRSVPCLDCNREFPPECMDFDHLPEFDKSFSIMTSIRSRSWSAILDEVEKCEIVCANCHRIRTKNRR